MAYVLAIAGGLAFGAADQYLGSRSALGAWVAAVSGMSAPWLVLPFVAGMTQERRHRAIALGLVVTIAALAGYFAMTYSPLENVPIARFAPGVGRLVISGYNPLWILGGLVSGPLYGYLGHRWRVARSWIGSAVVTAALCLEAPARRLVGMPTGPGLVWGVEVAVGVAAAGAFGLAIVVSRRSRDIEAIRPTA